jgi:hypothetical protein
VNLICEQENKSVMFNSITWGQYLSAIALLLALYYAFVGFKYFLWEILSLIGIKKEESDRITIPTQTNLPVSENPENYLPKQAHNKTISIAVQPFTDEVQAYLNQTETGISKNELIDALQQIFEKYPVTKSPEFRNELTFFIASSVNEKYPQLLRVNDISQLWG